jgi:hypothetical protein
MYTLNVNHRPSYDLDAQDIRRTLNGALANFHEAAAGDIVGIIYTIAYTDHVTAEMVTHYLRKTDTGADYAAYSDIAPEKQRDLAHATLLLADEIPYSLAVHETVSDMDPDDGETFYSQCILMRNRILIIASDEENLLERWAEEPEELEEGADGLIQILYPKAQSNHTALQMQSENEALADYLTKRFRSEMSGETAEKCPLQVQIES